VAGWAGCDGSVGLGGEGPSGFVDHDVVASTQQHQVGEVGEAEASSAVRAVTPVVTAATGSAGWRSTVSNICSYRTNTLRQEPDSGHGLGDDQIPLGYERPATAMPARSESALRTLSGCEDFAGWQRFRCVPRETAEAGPQPLVRVHPALPYCPFSLQYGPAEFFGGSTPIDDAAVVRSVERSSAADLVSQLVDCSDQHVGEVR
jgi:hypothetical protein